MGGHPKALIELGGRPLIARVRDAIRSVVDDLLVVTNTPEWYAFLGVPMVPDVYPDHGSLGGIYSGLKAVAGAAAFTVACDMPFVDPEIVRLVVSRAGLADVVVPRVGGELETMHAVYGKACLPHMEAELLAGRFRIAGFFGRVRVLEVPEAEFARHRPPHIAFMNVNTPEELTLARHLTEELG